MRGRARREGQRVGVGGTQSQERSGDDRPRDAHAYDAAPRDEHAFQPRRAQERESHHRRDEQTRQAGVRGPRGGGRDAEILGVRGVARAEQRGDIHRAAGKEARARRSGRRRASKTCLCRHNQSKGTRPPKSFGTRDDHSRPHQPPGTTLPSGHLKARHRSWS